LNFKKNYVFLSIFKYYCKNYWILIEIKKTLKIISVILYDYKGSINYDHSDLSIQQKRMMIGLGMIQRCNQWDGEYHMFAYRFSALERTKKVPSHFWIFWRSKGKSSITDSETLRINCSFHTKFLVSKPSLSCYN